VFVTVAAGVFFAGVGSVGLYVLAFPENRLELPTGRALRAVAARKATATGAASDDGTAGADEEPKQ